MECRYTLEWLDSLINVSLNPAKTDPEGGVIAHEQIQVIISRIEEEKVKHQTFLNNQVFSLLDERKIEVLIRQHYAALIHLLDQTWHNKSNRSYNLLTFSEVKGQLMVGRI